MCQGEPANSEPKFKSFRTKGTADQVDLRLFFPAGIQSQTSNVGLIPTVFQFRLVGSDTWINGPEILWQDPNASNQGERKHIRLIWSPITGGVKRTDETKWARAVYGSTPGAQHWKPNGYFDSGLDGYYADNVKITNDGVDVHLDPSVFPKGEYEIRLKRGLQFNDSAWTYNTYVWSGAATTDWYHAVTTVAPFESTNNQDDQNGTTILESVLTRSDDYPFTETELTLIAVQARGVKISSISAEFTSRVPTRDKYVWHFDEGLDGWGTTRADIVQSGSFINFSATTADPILRSPDGLGIDGSIYTTVRARIRQIVAATSWQGACFYSTDDHGEDAAFKKDFAEPTFDADGYADISVNMSSLTAGGSDWLDSVINQFRLDFDDAIDGQYEIDWIAVGVGDDDDWQVAPTNSPAALYRHVLVSDLNSKPLPADVVGDDELRDWYQRSLNKGYECNFIAQDYSVDQCKQLIAAAGWAVPQQGETWSVIQERDVSDEAPVQIFTQRNAANFAVNKAFSDLPHAIIGTFFDRANDYKEKEIIVYLDGYNAVNATLFDSLRYDGITRRDRCQARIGLDAGQLIHRSKRYSMDVDMSHLVSPRGALVALSNDFLNEIYDSAFIRSVTTSGGDITEIELDGKIRIEPAEADLYSLGNLYDAGDLYSLSGASGVTIQQSDGSTITVPIDETDDTTTLTLTTPLADPGTVLPGMLVAVGRIGNEIIRAKIFGVERVADLNARLVLVPEAPQLHS